MRTLLVCQLAMTVLLASCHNGGSSSSTETSSSMSPSAPSATIIRPGTKFSANPNPIMVSTTPRIGETTLTWHASVARVEIHVGSPSGPLFASGGNQGQAETGVWVTNNMTFYLQDGTAAKPTDPSASLASLPIAVQ